MGYLDGNVTNLHQFVNHWLAKETLARQYCTAGGAFWNLAVPIWLTPACKWANDHPTDRDVQLDGHIVYHLIEQRGDVAIWEIESMSVSYLTLSVFNPALGGCISQDLGTEDNWTGFVINVSDSGADPLCAFLLKNTVNWSRMFFMTASWPYEKARMRDNPRQYVIALEDEDPGDPITSTNAIWKLLMNAHRPEDGMFRNEAPWNLDDTYSYDVGPQADQYYEEGATK